MSTRGLDPRTADSVSLQGSRRGIINCCKGPEDIRGLFLAKSNSFMRPAFLFTFEE